MSPELLTPKELGERLNVAPVTIKRWYHAGIIPAEIAVVHTYRFDEAKVREALKERSKKGAAR